MTTQYNKDNAPMVSVWMITYNHEPYIAQAIEGVLMQITDFPVELIIGEDCSTDNTAKIIKEYQEKYPEIIKARYNSPNLGIIPNMVKTLEECTGKYIAMCEGDDYWTDPNKLQKQINFLENNKDYVLCFHSVKDMLANGTIENNKRPDYNNEHEYKNIEINNLFIPTPSVVFRNIIPDYSIFPKIFNGDAYLLGLLSVYGSAKYLNFTGAVYRIHENGISRSINRLTSYYKLVETYVALIKVLPKSHHPQVKNMIVGALNNSITENYKLLNNRERIKLISKFLKYCLKYNRLNYFIGVVFNRLKNK